ncbi:HipA domain-containing protein [Paucibacter sp. O1-1]|nr:HipA domain-containing protein [Paucibacter sp. O1-1]MDA3827022.1 HipA domain-containing protein [Paucibacter sp. O1-1]
MIQLAIWAGHDRVGTLSHDVPSNLFDFSYAEAWQQGPRSFPLSPQMPLFTAAHAAGTPAFGELPVQTRSAIARAFFQNLLPEGQALEVAAQANGLARGNLAGLLAALGAETAGALRVTLLDDTPSPAAPALRPLPLAELSERIRSRPEQPFSIWDGKVRLSIAGLQDKIAVYEDGGKLFLANGDGIASTVILKPAPANARLAELPAIEHSCMRLAAAAGIATARTRLLHVPEPVLLVERFDRRRSGDGGIERLHIIDACQALGLAPELKYERAYGDQDAVKHLRDGATLPGLFGLADLSPAPLAMRTQLLDRLLFNVLIGNSDAHGKNWSFFVGPQAGLLTLAPAYDLVDVEAVAHEHMSTSFAMGIGNAFSPEELTPFEWASMAAQCRLAPRHLAARLQALSGILPRLLRDAHDGLVQQGVPPALLARMEERLQRRCAKGAAQAADIAQVPPNLL